MTTVGRYSPNKVRKQLLGDTWAVADDLPSNGGFAVMFPTSVTSTGSGGTASTATVNTRGVISVTSAATVSINSCFSSTYINYLIMLNGNSATANVCNVYMRLRASGTDNSGSNYTAQYLDEHGPYRYAARATNATFWTNWTFTSQQANFPSGAAFYLYGPFLTQPTAVRSIDSVGHDGTATGRLRRMDGSGTHSVSTSYDGFTFLFSDDPTFTGTIRIYGMA